MSAPVSRQETNAYGCGECGRAPHGWGPIVQKYKTQLRAAHKARQRALARIAKAEAEIVSARAARHAADDAMKVAMEMLDDFGITVKL